MALLRAIRTDSAYRSDDDAIGEALELLRTAHDGSDFVDTDTDLLAPEQWKAEFRRWAESHACRGAKVDDSRDSIYSDRGA
ncbi:MAG: hypothetical protein KDA89_06690 [Planctomycetaceae bacterium]|nr:hypothetical protein [Planctomycetaceae bacterium]